MTPSRPSVPWSLSEARTAFLSLVLGAGLLIWSWWQVSGAARLSRQTTWLVVGVLGVMVVGLGSLLWVTSGRRAVRVRRDHLGDRIEDFLRGATPVGPPSGPGRAGLVGLRGSVLYHRDGCLLVHGKPVNALRGPGRRRPCEMCEP